MSNSVFNAVSNSALGPHSTLADRRAVDAGIAAYEQRKFIDAFDMLYPIVRKFKPAVDLVVRRNERVQPARVTFDILTLLADRFPAAQYRAAQSLLLGQHGVSVCPTIGVERLADAADKGYRPAMAFLAQCYHSRDKARAYFWMTVAGTPRAIAFRDGMLPKMKPLEIEAGAEMVRLHVEAKSVDRHYQVTYAESAPSTSQEAVATTVPAQPTAPEPAPVTNTAKACPGKARPSRRAGAPALQPAAPAAIDKAAKPMPGTAGVEAGSTKTHPASSKPRPQPPAAPASPNTATAVEALVTNLRLTQARQNRSELYRLLGSASSDELEAALTSMRSPKPAP